MRIFTVLIVILLAACSRQSAESPPIPDQKTPGHDIAARINGQPITLEVVDRTIELGLYDLEWQKYQLRRASLNRLAGDQPGKIEILLEPPVPPRLSIDYDNRPIRGRTDAPVRIAAFCSYQSSHCVRLQPKLAALREAYKDQLSVAYFDFPQGFHRYGIDAALAVRCASEVKPNWDYLDSVFGATDDLNFRRFELLARQTRTDPAQFKACFDERRYVDLIKADIAFSQSLGFNSVPIVLINGLYIRGPKPLATYQFYIDQELDRLGVSHNENTKAVLTKLPLKLTAVIEARENTAVIEDMPTKESNSYKVGEAVLEGVMLIGIEPDRVFLDNDGVLEFLPLSDEETITDDSVFVPEGIGRDRVRGVDGGAINRDKSEIALSRAWLSDHLRDESALTQFLYKGDHKPSGFHVLKLADVEGNEFYETLGFRTGDVILQVNDEWIHEGQNPLWNELRFSDNIELKLMRRGQPVTYYYKIGD